VADVISQVGEIRGEAARQAAIRMRLDFVVQAHDCYQCNRFAYILTIDNIKRLCKGKENYNFVFLSAAKTFQIGSFAPVSSLLKILP